MEILDADHVTKTPEIQLTEWKVYSVVSPLWAKPTNHFVGIRNSPYEGRVSSAIMHFDPITMTGITNSGRVYRLIGGEGHNFDAEYVWDQWKKNHKVSFCEQISVS